MNLRRFLISGFAVSLCSLASSLGVGQVHEFQLANGIHVIINPVPESEDVGVETVYEVGFVDEPVSMVQSAHLLEHLVCYAPGAGFEAKGAMQWLNQKGMANAETLSDWTHYDYAAPAAELEKILEIEAARLQQKSFDKLMIAFEAKRVYQETEFVENNPKTGMLKHAFMALAHAWNYQSKSALVRGGLDDMDPGKLLEFYKATYRPTNLTIAITGKTTVEDVKPLLEKHFAGISFAKVEPNKIDWSAVPQKHSVNWDSKNSAVCVSWAPPNNHQDQVLLSLLGAIAFQKIATNAELKKTTENVNCSNNRWNVGDLPLYVYAMARKGEDLEEIGTSIEEAFKKELRAAAKNGRLIKNFAFQLEFQQRKMPWAQMQQQIKMLQQMGRTEKLATQMVLLQDALNRCLLHRLLGDKPQEMIARIKNVSADELTALVEKTLDPAKRSVVHIVGQK